MTIEIPKKEPLNIVPFIDIMLVLLAMVLSVSTFIAKGEIPIVLPESRSAQAPLKNSNEVFIQVTGEGTLHWNGEEATHEEIDERLRGISRDVRLVLRIDRTTSFEHFIRLLDMIKGVHHENFVIAAEKRG